LTDVNTYLYYYDCENRLIDVNDKSTGSSLGIYKYDFAGRRVRKTKVKEKEKPPKKTAINLWRPESKFLL